MEVLEAYAAFQQQRRRMPKEGGVRIPQEIYCKLTIYFKKGWDIITGKQHDKITKDKFPRNNTKTHRDNNSQVQMY